MLNLIHETGSFIRASEILEVRHDIKPVARQLYAKEVCFEGLICRHSPLGINLTDNDAFSNYGRLTENGTHKIYYISKDEQRILSAMLHELKQDHFNLGVVLGYPLCCINYFIRNAVKSNFNPIHPPTNGWTNITLRDEDICLLSHFPCSSDCEQSIKMAKRRLKLIEEYDPGLAKDIIKKLRSLPLS